MVAVPHTNDPSVFHGGAGTGDSMNVQHAAAGQMDGTLQDIIPGSSLPSGAMSLNLENKYVTKRFKQQ